MKKQLLMTAFALFMAVGALAQEGLKVGVSFGPAFVGTRSELNGISSSDLKASGVGYRLGMLGSYGLSQGFGLFGGMAVVSKRFDGIDDATTAITTLEIPFGVRMRTSEIGSGIYVGGMVGPTIDLNLSAKSMTGDVEVDVKDQFRSFGSSVKIGLIAEKEFDFGTVALMPSYNIGISNVATKVDGVDFQTRLGYFDLSLGFFF